jgi:hypothetical protein
MFKIFLIGLPILLLQIFSVGKSAISMEKSVSLAGREEILEEESATGQETIKWIDPIILKKLQEIKPASSKGYTFSDVLALFPPKTETVRLFLDGASVQRVYPSTISKVMEELYGKGASTNELAPNKPVYVFEGTHEKPISVPTKLGGKSRMSTNAQVTVISDVNGNALFTKTTFP